MSGKPNPKPHSILLDTPFDHELLTCWKEIAKYFGASVRTVQRWEHMGLPVHRPGRDHNVIFADPAELKAWALRSMPRNGRND
jgi:hypothetical protein